MPRDDGGRVDEGGIDPVDGQDECDSVAAAAVVWCSAARLAEVGTESNKVAREKAPTRWKAIKIRTRAWGASIEEEPSHAVLRGLGALL